MKGAAAELHFEVAARLRDEIGDLKKELRQMMSAGRSDGGPPGDPGDLRRPRPGCAEPVLGRGVGYPSRSHPAVRELGTRPSRHGGAAGRRNDASALTDPEGTGPRIFFQKVPEGKTARTGCTSTSGPRPASRTPRERMAALEAECERLVALGATRVRRFEPAPPASAGFIVMRRTRGQRVLPGLTDLPAELSARTHAERPLVALASAA